MKNMTDWKDIHPDFTEELQKEWESLGFDCEQVEKWIENACLEPTDAKFASYLKKEHEYEPEDLEDVLENLRHEYNKTKNGGEFSSEKKTSVRENTNIDKEKWKNIHSNFTPELVQEWISCGFSNEECQDWINISSPARQNIAIREPVYYAWLRDVVEVEPEFVLNYGDTEWLKNEYQQYLLMNQQVQMN